MVSTEQGFRLVCIGSGPGPKNVLIEFEDGSKTVVPYKVWKNRYAPRLASREGAQGGTISTTSNDFMSAIGVIDFDPEQRDVNGKQVTQFSILTHGQTRIRVTVWPELKVPAELLKKGLGIAVRGKYSQGQSQDGQTTYHNLSALSLGIGGEVYTKEDAPVVQKSAASTAEPAF